MDFDDLRNNVYVILKYNFSVTPGADREIENDHEAQTAIPSSNEIASASSWKTLVQVSKVRL